MPKTLWKGNKLLFFLIPTSAKDLPSEGLMRCWLWEAVLDSYHLSVVKDYPEGDILRTRIKLITSKLYIQSQTFRPIDLNRRIKQHIEWCLEARTLLSRCGTTRFIFGNSLLECRYKWWTNFCNLIWNRKLQGL